MTNPERFRPLVEFVARYMKELAVTYDVSVSSEFEIDADAGMRPFPYARPPVRLAPNDPAGAPIAVAFSGFPSVVVRCGCWYGTEFPGCGCDACGETADGQIEHFRTLVDAVVGGRFTETLSVPLIGQATVQHTYAHGDYPGLSSGERLLSRARARELLRRRRRAPQWVPWRLRTGDSSANST